ncbi:hypothetical protein VAWG006_36850 [Aeromonas enteropelogenes]|nr:hypothetical protein VAWG006_36850 [Aeromonas enteropelogenes]BEE23595.1 hypothetical protein VAWG007_36900 [Aeromonas enteropelogenes]
MGTKWNSFADMPRAKQRARQNDIAPLIAAEREIRGTGGKLHFRLNAVDGP